MQRRGGDVGALLHDGKRHILVDVTVRTPSMKWTGLEGFLAMAEAAKEQRYYEWLKTARATTDVFYAAISIHGQLGEGCTQLISHCAKLRAARACALEAQSQRAAGRTVPSYGGLRTLRTLRRIRRRI